MKGIVVPTEKQLALWAQKAEKNITYFVMESLKRAGVDSMQPIGYAAFKQWVKSENLNFEVGYSGVRLTVASTLKELNEIGYSNEVAKYPTLI